MNKGLDVKLAIIFAGLGFAAAVLSLAWIFNQIWGKDKQSLWGRIWQIEKFLLSFVAMTLSVFGILHIINYFMLVYTSPPEGEIFSLYGAVWLMIITSVTSVFVLIGAAASIVWLEKKRKVDKT